MDRIVLLGDYHVLKSVGMALSDMEIHGIHLASEPATEYVGKWSFIPIRDFHQLTIDLVEIRPQTVVYLSEYFTPSGAQTDAELTEIANVEVVQHLKDILDVTNSYLIVFLPPSGQFPSSLHEIAAQVEKVVAICNSSKRCNTVTISSDTFTSNTFDNVAQAVEGIIYNFD